MIGNQPDRQAFALVLGDSPVRLWGLSGGERLQRQLNAAGVAVWRNEIGAMPPGATVVILRADLLYDIHVIKGLISAPQSLLEVVDGGRTLLAAAHVTAAQAALACEVLRGERERDAVAGIAAVSIAQVAHGYDEALLKLDRPFVLPITADNRRALEELTFSGAYKGITDLVTKWLWPLPARWATHLCVQLGITPNQVTLFSLILAITTGVLFARGELAWGLATGWAMTFLDTVDGKLARVTVTSTQFGNIFDHAIDLIHPPLWYIAWGVGLALRPAEILGVPLAALYIAILAGYIGGRLCEGAFQRWIAPFSVFTWRPFDAYFRLIVARRNPSMIMLTAGLIAARPDLGLYAVTLWTVLSTLILLARVFIAAWLSQTSGPLSSWLTDIGRSVSERTLAVRLFTRAAPVPDLATAHAPDRASDRQA